MSISAIPIRVLALSRNQYHHYAPLCSQVDISLTDDWSPEVLQHHKPDVLVTLSDAWYESYKVIKEAARLRIPSLLMMDGIVEWRHIWEDPKYGSGGGVAFYQPVQTDKVACLGWQSARLFESWGNIGKCEIVGAPRFDTYLGDPVPPPEQHNGPKRLLVTTANTPGFTPEQIVQVERALVDLRDFLNTQSDWQPIWRVSRGLDEKLGLFDKFPDLRNQPLRATLSAADAVLTMPSTVILEAMLARRPTALIDYSNSPPYMVAAWNITAQSQIAPVLQQLIQPETSRLAYQVEQLHNYLECRTPAAPRLVTLLREMANIGRIARAKGEDMLFPSRILSLNLGGHAIPSEYFDWARLYPNHPVFTQHNLQKLQIQLTHAQVEIADLRRQLRKARRQTIFYAAVRRILSRS